MRGALALQRAVLRTSPRAALGGPFSQVMLGAEQEARWLCLT